MTKLFVSDSNLIIDLLWNHIFYVDYGSLYWRLYYDFDLAKRKLEESGIKTTPEQTDSIQELVLKFNIADSNTIPDLVLFQQVISHGFKTLRDKNIIQFKHDEYLGFQETQKIVRLIKILESDINVLGSIQFKFKTNKIETLSFDNQEVIEKVFNAIKGFRTDEEFSFYEKLLENPEFASKMEFFSHLYGIPSEAKDVEKKNVRSRGCHLIREYLYHKSLLGMDGEVKKITNVAAEFIGRYISPLGLLDHTEEQYNQNEDLQVSYPTYKNYLQKMIRSYL